MDFSPGTFGDFAGTRPEFHFFLISLSQFLQLDCNWCKLGFLVLPCESVFVFLVCCLLFFGEEVIVSL